MSAFDVPVEVHIDGDRAGEVAASLRPLWEFCRPADEATAEATVEATVHVVFDSDPALRAEARSRGHLSGDRLDDLLQVLTQRITLAAIDARAGHHLMLHAACLADPETGAAAAFVAPGGTGKTTFVSVLGPGRWYVTDETTVVRDDDTVVPYPKPLSVRRAPASLLKDETAPSALGLQPPRGPVRLVALCLLERDEQHRGSPQVETLGTLDALVALVPQTSHLSEMARPLQRLTTLCEAVGGVHRVTYREAADVADVVDELLGRSG
ncbi:hypothetical protein [Nostocoides sp. HKS02]|uniref:hypothetical protein n=1 Tax=Nostocoides sp. HKS02 TaxID=1813880 RepID=UPI0012B4C4C4|nr:hypothetical protein [Tetrasphaera sp. HKS02]QGN56585.1 hypothetical protein GKE56_00220 [Tetrasphaera sp. HKS02]